MIPGEIIVGETPAEFEANIGLALRTIRVSNSGDRPIQVGSHFHFSESNSALVFERSAALGYRLNIPAGTAVRFEPGDTREVELVALAGAREVHGLNNQVNGPLP
jgi:urease subunit beta